MTTFGPVHGAWRGARSRQRLIEALALVLLLAPAAGAAGAAESVPALREFTPRPGAWHLRPGTRVVARSASLTPEARTLAADLGVRRGRRARRGDVVLVRTRPDAQLGAEGYTLRVGRRVRIAAPTAAGVFYGGRTLLQLGPTVPRGSARDWPRYPERALMIDTGRPFYSRAWLAARIRELASLKLNRLHLHFSDNQGLRIQSRVHPEVVTQPALTQADVRRLVRVARCNHVGLVPELDMPGHMQAALSAHPELQLTNALGAPQPDKLDVTNPALRARPRRRVQRALWRRPLAHRRAGLVRRRRRRVRGRPRPGDLAGVVGELPLAASGRPHRARPRHRQHQLVAALLRDSGLSAPADR